MKSQKEIVLDNILRQRVKEMVESFSPEDDLPLRLLDELLNNKEAKAIQDYANTVSISRLGFNDHGPVHMRIVCKNALKILKIMHQAGVQTSLEQEGSGSLSDSMSAVILASFLHDSGMAVGRKNHELYSGILTYELIKKILEKVLPGDNNIARRVVISSLALEGIVGHMATNPIHSIEAGLILVSDGCDMTKGRARITLESNYQPKEGDIHKYSASAIDSVKILPGTEKPVHIEVSMSGLVGFFQVEEVLIPKIHASTIHQHIELYAGVVGEDMKRYL